MCTILSILNNNIFCLNFSVTGSKTINRNMLPTHNLLCASWNKERIKTGDEGLSLLPGILLKLRHLMAIKPA